MAGAPGWVSLSSARQLLRMQLAPLEEGLSAELLALPLEVSLQLGGLFGCLQSLSVSLLHIQHHVQYLHGE